MELPGGERAGQDKSTGRGSLIRYWAPTVVYIVLIMVMATRPAPKLPHVKHIDKYFHSLAYGVLAILSYRSFAGTGFRCAVVMTLGLGILVGVADEGIQFLNRHRTASRYDLLADIIGMVIGTLVVVWCRRMKTGTDPDAARRASERTGR